MCTIGSCPPCLDHHDICCPCAFFVSHCSIPKAAHRPYSASGVHCCQFLPPPPPPSPPPARAPKLRFVGCRELRRYLRRQIRSRPKRIGIHRTQGHADSAMARARHNCRACLHGGGPCTAEEPIQIAPLVLRSRSDVYQHRFATPPAVVTFMWRQIPVATPYPRGPGALLQPPVVWAPLSTPSDPVAQAEQGACPPAAPQYAPCSVASSLWRPRRPASPPPARP